MASASAEEAAGVRRESLLKDSADDGEDSGAGAAATSPTSPTGKGKSPIDVDAPPPTDGRRASTSTSGLFVSLRALRDGARDFLPSNKRKNSIAKAAEGPRVEQSLLAVSTAKPASGGSAAEPGSPLSARKKQPSGIPPREHAGWLWYKSGMIPQWKRRWFALRTSPTTTVDIEQLLADKKRLPKWAYDEILGSFSAGAGLLFYYKTDAATPEVLKGALNLRGSDGVEQLSAERAVGKLRFGFQLHVQDQPPLVLAAESDADRDAWVAALTEVTDHVRKILLLLSKSTSSSRDNLIWL